MTQESDLDRMQNAPSRAFDWVAQELFFPSEQSRHQLRQAYLTNCNEGHAKGARELRKAWSVGIRWPSGENWLEAGSSEDEDEDLQDLLFHRLVHVTHRIYRDPQVLYAIRTFADVTQVILNKDASYRGVDHCGYGFDLVMDAQQAIPLLQRPACSHPACWCSIDPIFSRMPR